MAAWRSYKLDGHVWEAFAMLCAGEADSAATLFEQLADRGYTSGEYAAALEMLTRRDWLEPAAPAGMYRVTSEGRAAREVVERLTDSSFYAPWSCMGAAEFADLRALLIRLTARLRASEEAHGA